MPQTEKERQETFELGRLAGIAEEHVRSLKSEIVTLKDGQGMILARIETLSKRVENLNNWRWIVVGFASAVAFVISVVVGALRSVLK